MLKIRDACRRPDDDFMLKSVILRASFEILAFCVRVCFQSYWESNSSSNLFFAYIRKKSTLPTDRCDLFFAFLGLFLAKPIYLWIINNFLDIKISDFMT